MKSTVVIGASDKPERYSYKAVAMLKEHGHPIYPVSPNTDEVLSIKCFNKLQEISAPIDTVTMYVSPSISSGMSDDILQLKPKRVIFNPGSENMQLEKKLSEAGVECVEACTLVMLRTNQF